MKLLIVGGVAGVPRRPHEVGACRKTPRSSSSSEGPIFRSPTAASRITSAEKSQRERNCS